MSSSLDITQTLWLIPLLIQLDYIDKQKAKHHSREKVEEVVTVDNYNSY